MNADRSLAPLPFHDALRDALRELEPEQFRWFASETFETKYAEGARLELLRSTYRMPRSPAHDTAYGLLDEVRQAFGIAAPATLYQAQDDGAMNAALMFLADEVHLVLRGPVLQTLTESELRALFGHELAHHELWTRDGGSYRATGALIEHVASRANAAPAHVQSALRYRRWMEIYADRGSFLACDELAAAVACLVKVETGLRDVDADAYLAQVEEAIAGAQSAGVTHPESFIRAFALKSWTTGGDARKVAALVEGPREVEALDLVQQRELTRTTRSLLEAILAPPFMRTETNLAHAKRFFADLAFTGKATPIARDDWADDLEESVAEYVGYVLLDFGMADPDIEELAMPRVVHLAGELGVREAMRKITKKELRLSQAAYNELETKGASALSRTADVVTEVAP
jgi:hypothetical protein